MSHVPESSFSRWLKKYKYLNIALIYLGTAMVVIHFAEAVIHGLHMPPLTFSLIVVLALVGLPIVLLIAWASSRNKTDLSAEGTPAIKVKKKIGGRFFIASAMSVVLFATAIFIYNKFINRTSASGTDKSIAVLPFKNVSVNKEENEPFCTGVTLELQKNLSWVSGIFPIAPQSVEKYRDSRMTIAEIAKELTVKYIVQGTVQRDNNKIKVFATLVDASSGRQIWTDDFSGEMENIFSLQEDIAKKIADALEVNISPVEKTHIARVSTKNTQALDAYYDAQMIFVRFANSIKPAEMDYNNIQRLCNKALMIDPILAEAYTLKAQAYWINFYEKELLSARFMDSVAIFCNKALEIDPNAIDAMVQLSLYYARTKKNEEALRLLEKANNLNSNNFAANRAMGEAGLLGLYYDPVRMIGSLRKAVKLDPLSVWTPQAMSSLAVAYMYICDFEKAISYGTRVLEQDSNTNAAGQALNTIVISYSRMGNAEKAIEIGYKWFHIDSTSASLYHIAEAYCYLKKDWQRGVRVYEEYWEKRYDGSPSVGNTHRWALALWHTGEKEKAMQLFHASIYNYTKMDSLGRYALGYDMAGVYAFLGDKKKAYELLHSSSQSEHWGWGMPYLIKIDPLFENLRADPEFKTMVQNALAEKQRLRERIHKMELAGEI